MSVVFLIRDDDNDLRWADTGDRFEIIVMTFPVCTRVPLHVFFTLYFRKRRLPETTLQRWYIRIGRV